MPFTFLMFYSFGWSSAWAPNSLLLSETGGRSVFRITFAISLSWLFCMSRRFFVLPSALCMLLYTLFVILLYAMADSLN